ncbi:MAG: hypothetical protein Q9176_004465 [Flavoplaca citrina]
MAATTYFTCTLGQAAGLNARSPHEFETITQFIDYQARACSKAPAVGFPIPSEGDDEKWKYVVFTFHRLAECSVTGSQLLELFLKPEDGTESLRTVALLCPSSLEFLFTWLGLMRLGYAVLLIAQTTPRSRQQTASDVAFLFHTSGTSSGLPKPIPQTNHAAVGVLPFLPHGYKKATLTTTPLYHGGIADCFRAWASGALIWLFPGKDQPITASNILKSLECARQAESTDQATSVRYFSSVPYVLQMVSAEPEGMKMLQDMEIVGVGGAALSQDVGDSLVHKGVNLVSRFGSAECGFLLSSHRDYAKDKEWQYLRNGEPDLLTFEEQHDGSGLSELVIRSNWPHMAKRNRDDGSFATADLFAPHPSIEHAWKYHSRADSQLTLITGKKFDPAPLEAAIAAHELLSDAMIFGNGMQSAGALLFRSEKSRTMDQDRLLEEVWQAIGKLNEEGQPHTRLAKSMLIVMDVGAPGLEKSSKGTTLRPQAEKSYQKEIQGAYDKGIADDEDTAKVTISDDEVPVAVLDIIKSVLGTTDRIPSDADLFSFGVDSVACMAIRAKLQSRILNPIAQDLPLNVVYDSGNVERLSKYLVDIRKGRLTDREDETQLMKDLVTKYSKFSVPPSPPKQLDGNTDTLEVMLNSCREASGQRIQLSQNGYHVNQSQLLTGATGALGAHILHTIRSDSSVSHIVCLVRASSPLAAHERVSKSLIARGKPGLEPFSSTPPTAEDLSFTGPKDIATSKPPVTCLPCTLSQLNLGISSAAYAHLANTTNVIIHAAWAVNFTARLRSFEKDHIAGLSHLLHLSKSSPQRTERVRFLFLSSTASVTNTPVSKYPIAENISFDPEEASPLGYSRSKWVAENICNAFHEQVFTVAPQHHDNDGSNASDVPPSTKLGPRIAILRIGQLTSDTVSGIWNTSEAYPLMLSTAPLLHALPDLGSLPLDWLPVDIAAKAVLEVADTMTTNPSGKSATNTNGCPVVHILNPLTKPTWSDLLSCIKTASPELEIEILPPKEWLARLEAYEGDVPAKKLVGLWKGAFGEGEDKVDGQDEGTRMEFGMEKAKSMSETMRGVGPLDEGFLERMWRWVEGMVGV